MAKKPSKQYICSNCGAISSTWSGKCHVCGEWNTLEEQITVTDLSGVKVKGSLKPEKISQAVNKDLKRLPTGIIDIDSVLGGGMVRGSVNLVAGQPGIGKSTLLLQIAANIGSKSGKVLYISGEESAHQVGMRAERLGVKAPGLMLATSNSADESAATIINGDYDLVVVDSIQTMAVETGTSQAGSVSQVTSSAQMLTLAAKKSNAALILVGHVTKEGSIAGPKILEHSVDVVLQIEGDRYGGFKVLRAVKNRYGSTNEAAIFEMTDKGMIIVDNPSAALLDERQVTDGSVVLATLEGSRPLLVEVQALVNKTAYGYPKRAASGFDLNRLNLLVAMLERRTKLKLAEYDIYINIVGGIQIKEPAADLAVCMAIASAAKQLKLKQDLVVFGEIGLSGEVRHVPMAEKRVSESAKLGFKGAIGPKSNQKISELQSVGDIRTALNKYLS